MRAYIKKGAENTSKKKNNNRKKKQWRQMVKKLI